MRNELEINANCLEAAIGWVIGWLWRMSKFQLFRKNAMVFIFGFHTLSSFYFKYWLKVWTPKIKTINSFWNVEIFQKSMPNVLFWCVRIIDRGNMTSKEIGKSNYVLDFSEKLRGFGSHVLKIRSILFQFEDTNHVRQRLLAFSY